MTHESQTRKLQPATAFKRAPMDSITGCLVARRKGSLRNLPISNETYRNERVVMDDDHVETFK